MTPSSFSNTAPGPSTNAQLHPRGRGSYVQQACSVCRHKKTRCDGKKPVCSGCLAANRADECSWVKDAAPLRKNRNEAFFEALKKRNDALKEYTNYLEKLLEKCRREHGSSSLADASYLQRRPRDDSDAREPAFDDFDHTNYGAPHENGDLEGDGTNGASIQTLIAPIQKLSLHDGSLMTFGSTSVFRFRPVVFSNPPSRFPAIIENPSDTYVLLVEGVDRTSYNPNFDWSRYLPPVAGLDRVQHDRALDLAFKFTLSWCMRTIPALFCRDMYRALSAPRSQPAPKTAHYSPMLHNALMALSLSLLDDPVLRDIKTRQLFANEAKKYIDTECSQPNLCTVSALSTLGTFHSSLGEQTLGFMYFGMSARMSQALGLDIDCSEWVKMGLIDEEGVLDRYWTFWTIFAQDVNWSLYVGRDFCVRAPTENDFKDMPVPFVDSEFDKLPFHYPQSGIPPQPGYLSKTFASTCELLVIARRIMNVVNGISKTKVRASVIDEMISDIDLQLNTWKDSLPPEVDLTHKTRNTATPAKLMMHLSYWWFFILLHRPYFHKKSKIIHSSDKEIDHVKLCKRAAENLMELIGIWRQLYTLRNTPINLVQHLFAAGTIYLLSGVQATSGIRVANKELKHSVDMLKLTLQYLREMGKSWQCATSIESIIRSLIEDRLKPAMEKRKTNGPTKAHLRAASDGDSIYMTNPPSRRSSMPRKPRSRQTTSRNDSGDHGSLDSPTISVHPALDDIQGAAHFNGSTSGSSNQELLSPWSHGSSPRSQPIPIGGRQRSPSTGSGSSSSGSPGSSIKLPGSPAHSPVNLSTSPTAFIRDASPAGSFHGGSPIQSMANSFSSPNPNSPNPDPETLFGMITALDAGGQEFAQYDYTNFDMSRYFAMLGGQNLPDVPFFGPTTISESLGSLEQGGSFPSAGDLPDFEFTGFGPAGMEHLTGTADSPVSPASAGGVNGFYPPLLWGGMNGGSSSNGAGSHSFSRRSASENFRPSHGALEFGEFDFTQGFR